MTARTVFLSLILMYSCNALQAASVTVLEPTAQVAGKSIAHYTGGWYNWAYNFPAADGDPVEDPDGSLAERYQAPPVFYVAGTYGTTVERSFRIRPNTHILIPLVNSFTLNFTDPIAPSPDDVAFVDNFIEGVDELFFEVDGHSFGKTGYLSRYLQSESFIYNAQIENVYGDPLGQWPNYIKGYWMMLEPLKPGNYTIRFGGGNSSAGFGVDVTAHVTVVPEPSTVAACVILAAGTFALRRRNNVARRSAS